MFVDSGRHIVRKTFVRPRKHLPRRPARAARASAHPAPARCYDRYEIIIVTIIVVFIRGTIFGPA